MSNASVVGFFGISLLLVRVPLGIAFKLPLPFDGSLDLRWWDAVFLEDAVRNHRGNIRVEEIEHAVLRASKAASQFMNSASQQVGFGPPRLVPRLAQSRQTVVALVLRLRGQLLKPVQKRARSVVCPVEN